MYRTFYPTEYIFSRMVFRKDMIGHKTNFSNFKMTKIISTILPDDTAMKVESYSKRKLRRSTNMWKLNHYWVKEEIKREKLS